MTANRRRKRRVRARVAKTGESYTAALRHLLRHEELRMRTYEVQPAGVTDIGNVRDNNEDHLLADEGLWVVADGMGGLAAAEPGAEDLDLDPSRVSSGQLASRIAVEAVREAFAADETAAGLVAAVAAANTAVMERGEAEPDRWLGTTIAAVALVADGEDASIAVVNVGDSRVYLQRGKRFERLSADHSRVADLVRAGELTEDEAAEHPERHILTQAIGIEAQIEPHINHVSPESGDRILLCSDGLFNELAVEEIADILGSVDGAEQAARHLVDLAKERGGNDNITAVVVNIR